jgi:aldose 1-epimerase
MTIRRESMAAESSCTSFGRLADGRQVEAITLANSLGIRVRIITLGATLQAIYTPDAEGSIDDIVLGYDDPQSYCSNPAYFGVTLGRYANRIARGKFSLDGKSYTLTCNDGPNTLHGGSMGFGRRLWSISGLTHGRSASVALTYESPDADDGFPGSLQVKATFSLRERDLIVTYTATTDAPTIVNLSNHSYFNLGGRMGDSILRHRLRIPARWFLPVDQYQIPTGELRSVTGTPFDFRRSVPIGERIHDGTHEQLLIAKGYDHNFVLRKSPASTSRRVAELRHLGSGRVLEVLSNQPGLQFYTGNSLDGAWAGKNGRTYRQTDGLALEPQLFPDTPNQPAFGSARLLPGQTYRNRIIYRMGINNVQDEEEAPVRGERSAAQSAFVD